MNWREALEIVVSRSGHERYRELCAEAHPEHAAHRERVVAKAAALAGRPAPRPPDRGAGPQPAARGGGKGKGNGKGNGKGKGCGPCGK